MAKKKWIQEAIKNPGSLTEQAKKAGMSVAEFCSQDHKDSTTQRRCNLYKTLRKLADKGKK